MFFKKQTQVFEENSFRFLTKKNYSNKVQNENTLVVFVEFLLWTEINVASVEIGPTLLQTQLNNNFFSTNHSNELFIEDSFEWLLKKNLLLQVFLVQMKLVVCNND